MVHRTPASDEILEENRVGLAVASSHEMPDNPYGDQLLIDDIVNEALCNGGLGVRSPKAPLADVIQPGATVLLKPNWVHHRNFGNGGLACLTTNPAVILAVIKQVAAAGAGRIVLGDAPIQDCVFESLVAPEWLERFAAAAGCPLSVVDLRRSRMRGESLADGITADLRPLDRYTLFDLGTDSLLEPITGRKPHFRVTKYDPNELSKAHSRGHHQYLLAKETFEVDVLINLPKLKTHSKAGLTGALKNLVGLNGNKDFLPHHRVGGTSLGGDCYAGISPLRRLIEFCLDHANAGIDTPAYHRWNYAAERLLRWQRFVGETQLEGRWRGNDTVWRMVLDLNRLILHGDGNGAIHQPLQRRVISVTDAMVVGDGEGPLAPSPRWLGAVTFACSSPYADLVHASLLRFDWQRLALLRESFGRHRIPLTTGDADDCRVVVSGHTLLPSEVARLHGIDARAPAGWKGYVEIGSAMVAA